MSHRAIVLVATLVAVPACGQPQGPMDRAFDVAEGKLHIWKVDSRAYLDEVFDSELVVFEMVVGASRILCVEYHEDGKPFVRGTPRAHPAVALSPGAFYQVYARRTVERCHWNPDRYCRHVQIGLDGIEADRSRIAYGGTSGATYEYAAPPPATVRHHATTASVERFDVLPLHDIVLEGSADSSLRLRFLDVTTGEEADRMCPF